MLHNCNIFWNVGEIASSDASDWKMNVEENSGLGVQDGFPAISPVMRLVSHCFDILHAVIGQTEELVTLKQTLEAP